MAFVEVFVSASSLGPGVLSASFYYNECGNTDNILQTSSASTASIFSRDEFLNGITLDVPIEATTLHVKPTNKECRACEDSVIILS